MSRIEIHELDETSASREASNVNVVFVPGYANFYERHVYFLTTAGETPDTDGFPSDETVYKVFNIADGKQYVVRNKLLIDVTGNYKMPKFDAPMLFENEEDFIDIVGDKPMELSNNIAYSGFSQNSFETGSFFNADGIDKSYLYARELLHAGLPVLYYIIPSIRTDEGCDVSNCKAYHPMSVFEIYDYLCGTTTITSILDDLSDKGNFDIKYLTTGGYPAFEYGTTSSEENKLVKKLIKVAKNRGDCVALIDHTDYANRSLVATDNIHTATTLPTNPSVYDVVNASAVTTNKYAIAGDDAKFAAMFTPWALTRFQTYSGVISMPASFSYLKCLAKAIQTNADWLAMAGVARGIVPDLVQLNTSKVLSNTLADKYQPRDAVAINPITYIRNYGYTVWGNRTLFDNAKARDLTASSFLNVRNMVSNIKKLLLAACQSLMFEPNSDILWINFQALLVPTLDQMKTGYGLENYKILQGKYNSVTGKLEQPKDKAKLYATIKLWPVYAVESFDVTVVITDQDVEVETDA